MARLTRKNLKIFASGASNNGIFGSLQANNPVTTTDIEQIQSLPAWEAGWNLATETSEMLPPLEEAQAVDYVETYQTAYILQEGVPEWHSSCEYHTGSWVKSNASGEWKLYQSLADNNTGNLVTDTSKWQSVSFGGGLEVGDVGIAPLGIDETENRRRYLNGQVISQSQFPAFTQKVKNAIASYPSLGTTEALWQQAVTDSDLGQCGQFVVDDVNQTIRLPKVVNIQGLQTLSGNLGTTISAGVPNIEGEFSCAGMSIGTQGYTVSGAFTHISNSYTGSDGYSSNSTGLGFDASQSNSIYGNSTTVQAEAVQYPYFIQVATGGETDIDVTTEIQLSNPFFFGMYQWFQTDPNNASWLESNGAYNAKTVYPSYYNWLLSIYNDTGSITGFNVKDTTDTYTDYDFVLNLNDETFRLPIKVRGKTGDAVVGNGIGLTYYNTDQEFNIQTDINSGLGNNYHPTWTTSGHAVGESGPAVTGTSVKVLGLSTDASKSGAIVDTTGMTLYFYVGAIVQDADIINAAAVLNEISNIKDGIGFTNNAKSEIAGFSMPDYSAGVSKSWNTAILADHSGWVCAYDKGNANNSSYVLEISIDGVTWYKIASVFASTSTSGATIIPISKGVYYKASEGINDSSRTLIFYPCIGG